MPIVRAGPAVHGGHRPQGSRADRGTLAMADQTFDVVGIGNAIVDIIARCDEAFLAEQKLPKGHMRLIDAVYQAAGLPLRGHAP